ncbi:MAG: ABC transporter substrate-binding protein, partial [Bauldia sp.]
MTMRPSRRQLIAAGSMAAVAAPFVKVARAQEAAANRIHIGTVFPARTGLSTVLSSINDYPGEGGRNGAILGETAVGELALAAGVPLDVLLASSPSVEAARRAGERLVEANNINILIGGVGEGQADILSQIAEEAQIPFFNVGEPSDALRAACRRFTFHIEPSDAMYLDALAMLGREKGYTRWFLIYPDDAAGQARMQRATRALQTYSGGEVVGGAAVTKEQPVYANEANAIGRSGADVMLVMLDAIDQIAFLNQMETLGVDLPPLVLPTAITQTRDFTATIRFLAAINNPRETLQSWETTYTANGAEAFNQRYLARWSEAVDPTGWATYHAIKIAFDVHQTIGTLDGPAVVEYLESPEAVFDVLKGPGTSFRPWDHQLRQPIQVVRVDQEVEWIRANLQSRVAIAAYERDLPVAA